MRSVQSRRRLRRLLPVALLALAGLAVSTNADAAEITQPNLYTLSYSDTILRYDGATATPLTLQQWSALGSPAPQPVRSEVVKYRWSPTLYAVTFFQGDWEWHPLSSDEWARMGFQAPYDAGWIAGSKIVKYASSDELILAAPDGSVHKLSYGEWAATGFHSIDERRDDLGFVQFRGSTTISPLPGIDRSPRVVVASRTTNGKGWASRRPSCEQLPAQLRRRQRRRPPIRRRLHRTAAA